MNFHEDLSRIALVKGSSDRSFGIVLAAAFAIAGVLPLRHGAPVRIWALAAAGAFLLIALIYPAILHWPNRGFSKLGLMIGRVTNPIVTALLFGLVFVPMGLILRLMGKDPLRLKLDPNAATYWIHRDPPGPEPESMRRQF